MGSIDWTTVIVAGLTAIPATLAAVLGFHTRGQLKTASGDKIGEVVERTHDLAALATFRNQKILDTLNGAPTTEEEPK